MTVICVSVFIYEYVLILKFVWLKNYEDFRCLFAFRTYVWLANEECLYKFCYVNYF